MKAIRLTLTSILFFLGGDIMAREVEPECETKINTETVFGKVMREDSRRPIQNVTVTAIMQNKKEKYTITDNEGEFGIEALKPGMYKFIFEKDGYRRVVKERVNIKMNEPVELNIEMEFLNYNLAPSPFHFFLVDTP